MTAGRIFRLRSFQCRSARNATKRQNDICDFDYYWKYNNDMLSNLQLPHTIGISVPAVNVGKLKTWGWEFEVKWADRIADFHYQVAFNISDSKNELVEYDGADVITAGNVSKLEGCALNTIWGYTTDGYWSGKEEYDQFKADHPGYKSFSDGKVADEADLYVIEDAANRGFDPKKDYYYPIPTYEIATSDGNVKQNPGWN